MSTTFAEIHADKSTNVRTDSSSLPKELSKTDYLRRAMLLRLPLPNRISRAIELFCTPLPGARARATKAEAPEFKRVRIQVGELSIQAYVYGDPRRHGYVLCSHGWSSFGLRFAPWQKTAAEAGLALVSFDHIAHGRSEGSSATFQSFIDGADAVRKHFGEPALAVGHSFGAAALAFLAAERGLRAPLVLVAPPANLKIALEYFVRRLKLPHRLMGGLEQELSRIAGRQLSSYQAKWLAGNIRQSLLVIHDIDDDEVSLAAGEQYAVLAPHGRLLATSGLGHHHILTDAQTQTAALKHWRGEAVGERLSVAGADWQSLLAQ
jgi:pimeloyl-ACP methyl ester carboxylesterase